VLRPRWQVLRSRFFEPRAPRFSEDGSLASAPPPIVPRPHDAKHRRHLGPRRDRDLDSTGARAMP